MPENKAVTFDNPVTVAPPIGAYSHIASVPAGSSLLVLAGQVGCDAQGVVPPDAETQYENALRNIVRLLESQGAGPEHLIKINTYLVGRMELARVKAIRVAILGDAAPPATMVYVAGLAAPQYQVEVEAWAVRPDA